MWFRNNHITTISRIKSSNSLFLKAKCPPPVSQHSDLTVPNRETGRTLSTRAIWVATQQALTWTQCDNKKAKHLTKHIQSLLVFVSRKKDMVILRYYQQLYSFNARLLQSHCFFPWSYMNGGFFQINLALYNKQLKDANVKKQVLHRFNIFVTLGRTSLNLQIVSFFFDIVNFLNRKWLKFAAFHIVTTGKRTSPTSHPGRFFHHNHTVVMKPVRSNNNALNSVLYQF